MSLEDALTRRTHVTRESAQVSEQLARSAAGLLAEHLGWDDAANDIIAAVEAIAQLGPGDFVVHADHGIGIYRGLVELDLRGAAGEFLRLEYADGDRLFLPVDRLNRIQVYAELQRDPTTPSGLSWTSPRGPEMEFSAGTTMTVRAAVDERPPISFIVPILREAAGID